MSIRDQRGISSIGWLMILAVGAFFMLCAFRMVPAYVDNRYAQEALKSLSEHSANINDMSPREIRRKAERFFTLNNLRSISVDQLDIVRRHDRTLVNLNYEVRVPIIYNVDAVMTFKNQWDSARPDECCSPPADEKNADENSNN